MNIVIKPTGTELHDVTKKDAATWLAEMVREAPGELTFGPVQDESYGEGSQRFGLYLDGHHIADVARQPEGYESLKHREVALDELWFEKGSFQDAVRSRVEELDLPISLLESAPEEE